MDILLFNNLSDNNYLYKKLQPIIPEGSEGPEILVHFLKDSSIVDPELELSATTKCDTANYMYIPKFGRYYWITNWDVSQGKIIISGHADPLMSFKNHLNKTEIELERSEFEYNLYLPDDELPLEVRPGIRTIEFDNSFEEDTHFILILAGDNSGGE